jgi:eukaryotic-like serine/threonine-protein kinase
MASGHNSGVGARVGAAPALLLALLATAAWLVAEPLAGLESRVLDVLQRLQAEPGSGRVVLVSLDESAPDWWNSPDSAALATAIARLRPLAVVPAGPTPAAAQLPDLARLATLVELEQRRRGNQGGTADPIAAQLARIEATIRVQDQALETLAAATRLVLPVAVGGSRDGTAAELAAACAGALHPLATAPAGTDTARARSPALPRPGICARAWLLGADGFASETDGHIRRLPLASASDLGALPSATLAAAAAAEPGMTGAPSDALAAVLDRTNGAAAYLRFYAPAGDRPAFRSISASQLVKAGNQLPALADSVLVIGTTTGTPGTGLATAVDPAMAPALLLATGLSNLLEQDYLLRPGWLRWLELGLLITVALWAGLLGWRMPGAYASALALALALLLLGLEFFMLQFGHTWLQLVTVALFAPLAAVGVQAYRLKAAHSAGSAGPPLGSREPAVGQQDVQELDLAFSVLRQQPASPATKKRLYNIAMEHGRRRDFARAERVLTHLAGLDPDYRDVIYKLSKLSGARQEPEAAVGSGSRRPEPQAADQLGRYRLEGIIGRGAMATVYLGRDPMINRRVAIKTIPLADEFSASDLANARAQFIREAESAGRLNHPHIIAIYDAGEDNRTAYLAMEYFDGRPLSHYAQAERLLPPEVVLELMARAADALHYAHAQKVVHRDIKPANLLYHEASDTLKLTDFGIARLTDSSRTRSGIILGTPSYMSPEQLSAASVTGQSDLYSLGVTMYHLLTGSPPFQADSIPRLMEKIAHQRHRPVREFRDDIPACVDRILDEAMAKRPDDRFANGRAMALALRDCCSRLATDVARTSSA